MDSVPTQLEAQSKNFDDPEEVGEHKSEEVGEHKSEEVDEHKSVSDQDSTDQPVELIGDAWPEAELVAEEVIWHQPKIEAKEGIRKKPKSALNGAIWKEPKLKVKKAIEPEPVAEICQEEPVYRWSAPKLHVPVLEIRQELKPESKNTAITDLGADEVRLDLNSLSFKNLDAAKDRDWEHDEIQKEVIRAHAKALRAAKKPPKRNDLTIGWFSIGLDPVTLARRHTFFAFIRAVFYGTVGIWWQILNNPSSLFSIGAVYGLFIYLAIFNVMLVAEVVLIIFDSLGGSKLADRISEKYGWGYTLVNWSLPQMFGDLHSIEYAKKAMVKDPPKIDGTVLDRKDEINFHLDICRTLLLMSSLVYERESRWIETANALPQYCETLIPMSEVKITHIAKKWKTKFVSVADFGNLRGSTFCGIYYDEEMLEPWIVLAFKGTGPTNYAEWLVDCTISHEDAGDYLWGYCHDGFYTQLFPSSEDSEIVPYEQILSTIKLISKHIITAREKALRNHKTVPHADKIHLYVTGHSLGAAMASLCYARMLKCPEDFKSNVPEGSILPIELRDCYTFGTPRVGNTKFADGFDACMNLPQNQHRTLWRVANDQDIVAHVPPGVGDLRSRRSAVRDNSLINYAAIGTYVNLRPNDPTDKFYFVNGYTMKPGREFKFVQEHRDKLEPRYPIEINDWKTFTGIQNFLGGLLIPKLNDHFTTGYYNSLQLLAGEDTEKNKPSSQSTPI